AKAPAHEPRDLWHESKFGTYKGEIKDKSGITVEINTDGLTVTTTIDGHEYRPHTFKTAAKRDRHIQTRANIFAGYDLAFSGSDEATTPKKRAARKAKAPEIAPELLELAQKLQVWANKQGVDINAILSGETPSSAPDILKAMAADKPLDAKAPAKEETSAPTIQSTPEPMPSAPTKEDASAPTINTQAVLFEGAEPTADAKAPEMPVTDPKPNWTERELEDAAQMFEERAQMYHERAKDADDQTAQRAKADAESAESSARQTRANLAAKRAATAPTDTARAVEEVKARRQHEAAFKAWTSLNETATSEDIKSASRNLNAACDALNAILSTPEHEAAQQHRANMARYFAELRTIRPTTTPALDTNDITDKQNARASIIPKRADKRRTSPRATSPRTTNRTNHHSNRRSMNTRNIPAARHRTEQDGGRI
ncbi:MAG: hypothetical protein JWQ03_3213, partial [Variovorax sp.]|nr:hypothetical protein [Variovorax sp.]